MSEKQIPEIRFEGFNEEWNSSILSDVVDVFDGTHQTPKYTAQGIMFLSVENIKTLQSEKYISEHDFLKDFKAFPQKNDVLMTRIGDIGTANVVENDSKKAYYVSLALLKHKSLNSFFLKESIGSGSVKKEIWHRTLHIAFPKKINKNEIEKVKIKFPKDDSEQSKIGDFFKNLDDLIALNQSKYDKLVNMKKACLDKMFPKDGADVPEIRFEGFRGEWERKYLLKCVDKIIDFRGRTPKKLGLDWSEDGYLALSALNVKMGYIDKTIDAHYGDEELYSIWMKGNELHKGQVLFTTEAPMGNVAQVPDDDLYVLSQRTIAFEVCQDISTENYLALALSTTSTYGKLLSMASGGTAKGVSQKSLSELQIMLPIEIDEQTKIGEFFLNLDNLITLRKTELEKLKNIKKALLDKMFV